MMVTNTYLALLDVYVRDDFLNGERFAICFIDTKLSLQLQLRYANS